MRKLLMEMVKGSATFSTRLDTYGCTRLYLENLLKEETGLRTGICQAWEQSWCWKELDEATGYCCYLRQANDWQTWKRGLD